MVVWFQEQLVDELGAAPGRRPEGCLCSAGPPGQQKEVHCSEISPSPRIQQVVINITMLHVLMIPTETSEQTFEINCRITT